MPMPRKLKEWWEAILEADQQEQLQKNLPICQAMLHHKLELMRHNTASLEARKKQYAAKGESLPPPLKLREEHVNKYSSAKTVIYQQLEGISGLYQTPEPQSYPGSLF
jgi:hypothetical protein